MTDEKTTTIAKKDEPAKTADAVKETPVEVPAAGGDPDTRKRVAKTRLGAAEAAANTAEVKAARAELDAIDKELRAEEK